MEYDIPASQKDRQLPMIINLRGDEDLVDEFNWDADQVMEFLGIKRSRLTQISGKELRVARIRRDRYLRPVYREADVRDYQEWTRATATHQSSSRAIEQAIDSLDDRFSDILVVLQEKLLQYEERSTSLLKQQLHKLDAAGFERFQQLQDEAGQQRDLSERHEKHQARALNQLQQQNELLSTWHKEWQDLRAFLGSFHQDIRALLVAQQALRRDMEEAQVALHSAMEQQTENMKNSWQDVQEALAALKAGQEQILKQTEKVEPPAPLPEVTSAPQMRKTRRPPSIRARRLPVVRSEKVEGEAPQSSSEAERLAP
jgi:chromosome segregation ATPase